ncbi:MAG: EAL domain-containing protein [Gemmatimonadota bacterium]
MIRLAKTLDFSVVAEGVETREQEELLREMECDYVQGYRYHRPLTVDRIPEILNGGL